MFPHPFVVLDLETSGIDPKKDDIIEVALIRYEQGKEVDRYQALIRREQPLPELITHITGITDAMLQAEGKGKNEVLRKVEQLLQGAYLVGHNISFDSGFLRAHQVSLSLLGELDTVPLAQIAFPDRPSYSLESLTEDLAIEHGQSHRAMADVEATLALMMLVWEKVSQWPSPTLVEVQKLQSRSTWVASVFFRGVRPATPIAIASADFSSPPTVGGVRGGMNVGRSEGDGVHATLEPSGPDWKSAPANEIESAGNGIRRPLSIDELFGSTGIMARQMEGYEGRHQQIQMAEAISQAFGQNYHLICEAPTGVGKSLAYLSAAAELSIRNKSKVVIATHTVNLQEQLYEKDVPLLQSLYRSETGHPGVTVALLKGRSHYLCLRRLADFKQRPHFGDHEIILLSKILAWRAVYPGRDLGEMNLTREEELIWDFELCADQRYCTPQKCKNYGPCDLQQARKAAENADLLIVNHALLCADLEAGGSLLPDYRYLVVDEAHHFEEVVTQAFGTEVKQEHLSIPLKTLGSQLQLLQKRFAGTLFTTSVSFEAIDPLIAQVTDLQDAIQRFFDLVAFFVTQNVEQSAFVENLLIDKVVMGMEEWLNLGESFRDLHLQLEEWLKPVRSLSGALAAAGDDTMEYADELMQEVSLLQEQLLTLHHFFATSELEQEWIRWIVFDTAGAITLHVAPLFPGHFLKESLYEAKTSIIFTSATLGVQLHQPGIDDSEAPKPFEYFRRMLGLDDRFEELVLDSPFDFEAQTYIITPKDLLSLQSRDSVKQVSDFFLELLRSVKGSTMGLFTSHSALQHVYLNIAPQASAEGVKVLGQRISGGRGKILKAYMKDPKHSALLGVNRFWEGVDLQGEALTTLVIHKLPFDVPSDPIVKVRSQMFHNGFMEYCVPRAILRFRQGFGRLIRSQKDYGVMILLDNRVLTQKYGQMFLQALPENVTIESMSLDQVPGKVKEWLEMWRKEARI